jgi:hypothetical protein
MRITLRTNGKQMPFLFMVASEILGASSPDLGLFWKAADTANRTSRYWNPLSGSGVFGGHLGAVDNRRPMLFVRIRTATALQCVESLR